MKLQNYSQQVFMLMVIAMSLLVSACSTTKSEAVISHLTLPALPNNLAAPCAPLEEITDLSAKANYLWQFYTITKYNECSASKDALVNVYNTLKDKLNEERK